jgi:hypothetical protein
MTREGKKQRAEGKAEEREAMLGQPCAHCGEPRNDCCCWDDSGEWDVEEKRCPDCGGELYHGFGLAGGGYGAYETCECGYFFKIPEEVEGAS